MDDSPHSKRVDHDRFTCASFDSPCCHPCVSKTGTGRGIFRSTENSRAAIAGNITPIVHTALAFDPTAQEAAR